MEKKTPILDQIGRKHGMKVPEEYFSRFAEQLTEQLPEREFAQPEAPSLWVRIRPYVYMAAMFAGVWLMMKMFTGILSVERGETPDAEYVAAVEELSVDDELISYYVDDFTAYEMLYADNDY